MRRLKILVLAVALVCSSCGMFNKRRVVVGSSTTLGAELRDLQRAREAGALTEDEYRAVKAALEHNEARVLYPVAEDDR